MKAERRYVVAEVRATEGAAPKIAGHAALFNVRSQDLGGFVEIVAPGAFDACLATNPDILGLFNHDPDAVPLGRTSSGTLRVWTDDAGLAYEIDPPGTQLSNDLLISLRRRDVRGSSFGFWTKQDDWTVLPGSDLLLRTLLEVDLFDVSPVTNPAYLQTNAAVRSQLPQHDVELKAKVVEMRSALKLPATPDFLSDEERQRLVLMYQLAELL